MDISNAFAALERIINVAAQDQYSESIVHGARAGLEALRSERATAKGARQGEIDRLQARLDGATDACDRLRSERDLWQRRANAQLEITRAAVAIVAAPFQVYDSTIGHSGYRISTREFEDLQRAVEAYKKLAEQEAAAAPTG